MNRATPMTTLIALYVGAGLALVILAIPLMQRRVKPNTWYGFRTPSTLRDADLWYDANVYSGRLLFIYGMMVAVAGTLLALLPDITPDSYNMVMLVITMIGLFGMLILCWNYLRTYPHKDKTDS